MSESIKQKGALLLVAAGVGLAGAFLGLKAWRGYRDGVTAKGWPTAEAVVTDQATVDESHDVRESRDREKITAVLRYRYTVNGVEHAGETRDGLAGYEAKEWLEARPVGKSIAAHYNPAVPSESLVDPSFTAGTIFYAVGALLGVVGAVVLIASLFKRRRA